MEMEEKVTIGGVEIPHSDWEQTPASVKAVVQSLSETVEKLNARLAEIEERLGLNSENSSIPPSKQTVQGKKEKKS